MFLAATKQLYKWYFPSVCLSVCLSVCHTFLTMFPSSYHHEIFWSYSQWRKQGPCKRSSSEVKGQGHRSQDPTFPDCNSSLNSHMMMKWCTQLDVAQKRCPFVFQGHPSNFKVTRLKRIFDFDPNWAFPDCNSRLNSQMATKWCTKLEVALKRCRIVFQGHPSNFKVTRLLRIVEFDPNLAFPDCNSSLNSPMVTKWCSKL